MADWLFALITLSVMEIVLGVDNIIFLAILVGRLPEKDQPRARKLGLGAALLTRLLLLFCLNWLMGATAALFHWTDLGLPEGWFVDAKTQAVNPEVVGVSVRDLILFVGGLFLIAKSTHEIHAKLEGPEHGPEVSGKKTTSFGWVIVQIALIDIIFSLDSVITAVGMAENQLAVMVAAMLIAMGVMFVFAGPISDFVHRHPTMKMLALSFLILIGVMLVADGLGFHVPRGYIYFAMGFSVVVELLNMRVRKVTKTVALREPPPVRA
jgi:predicted tellurium resistance membrane protein TerC